MKDKRGISGVKRLLAAQLIICLVIALALLLVWGEKESLSALLGGLVAIIPSALFARKLFRYQGARAARQIVKGFYLGEALKIVATIALFTFVFMSFKIAPLVFFFTYIVVLMSHWLAPLFFANKLNRPEK
ncbi:ATP synthase subunit I [Legionella hackeliae]|uniref:ATP synthase protein I n=1 Tax=Legionella hackeliae TaxID=449 RepID=A0A0A8UYL8_LEGHA|nr:ATP synthase subunit I [Legionella hackeliae]KTD12788.1 ATP synthase subunit I [Legionella hackeliae]CEK12212.1 ATP synthase protein I [Legionella hackeliae]STX48997.1 ATP synthase subunit I [Legionella hackeliae]